MYIFKITMMNKDQKHFGIYSALSVCLTTMASSEIYVDHYFEVICIDF